MTSATDTTSRDAGAPLAGRSVLVTRTREQAAALIEPLQALGAEVLCFPVIEVTDPEDTAPLDAAVASLADYDWLVITSTNGVDRFLDRAAATAGGQGVPDGVRVAAVGSATAARLLERGVEPDFVPADFRAEGLLEGFAQLGVGDGDRILIARALEAREILPQRLREMGAEVEVVATYRVVPAALDPAVARRLAEGGVDIATFASGGTFKHFLAALECAGLDADAVARSLEIASVGPVTTEAVRSLGYDVALEARESTMASLVETIVKRFGDGG